MSNLRSLETINMAVTLVNNLIESQRAALEQQLKTSREADYSLRLACFPREHLPEYWEKIEAESKVSDEKKELLKHKPVDLVPTSVDIIIGCGGGDRFFRQTLLRYLWSLMRKYLSLQDYYNYSAVRKAFRAYGGFLWNLSADWVLKNNDTHELSLSAAITLQQMRVIVAREGEKYERESER